MKRFLLVVCAVVCAVSLASAKGKASNFFKSYDWTPKYKGEINVGFAMTGSKTTFKSELNEVSVVGSRTESETSYDTGSEKTNYSRLFIETIQGAQFDKYLFVGAGLGLQYYTGKLHNFQEYANLASLIKEKDKTPVRWNGLLLPIFANIRFMCPVKEDLVPYLNLGIGGTVGLGSSINAKILETLEKSDSSSLKMRLGGGLYCDFGAGVRWKCMNFAIGLQSQGLKVVVNAEEKGSSFEYTEKMTAKTTSNSFYLKVGVSF